MTNDRAVRLLRWRRGIRRHRRPVAALLTFLAVLVGLSSVRADAADPGRTPQVDGRWQQISIPGGSLAAPVRVTDGEVVGLLRPGDVVDVVAADGNGGAAVVASSVTVVSVPGAGDSLLGSDPYGGALVVVAVPTSVGVSLAAAAALGPVSLLIHP